MAQSASLDFTIVIPAFISVEVGGGAKRSAPGGVSELLAVLPARADQAAPDSAGNGRMTVRAISNGGTLATRPTSRLPAGFAVALP